MPRLDCEMEREGTEPLASKVHPAGLMQQHQQLWAEKRLVATAADCDLPESHLTSHGILANLQSEPRPSCDASFLLGG